MTQRDILREFRLIVDGIRIGVAFYSICIGTIFYECTIIYILNVSLSYFQYHNRNVCTEKNIVPRIFYIVHVCYYDH